MWGGLNQWQVQSTLCWQDSRVRASKAFRRDFGRLLSVILSGAKNLACNGEILRRIAIKDGATAPQNDRLSSYDFGLFGETLL